MTSAELWTQQRNLSLLSKREALIYILGRIGREAIPPELWVFLAKHPLLWTTKPQGSH